MTELDLYATDPHAYCSFDGLDVFCRNPLHPGPCKGWKHMLHSVAPGAFHAYEKQRVAKLEEARKTKVAHLQGLGHKVPPRLLKPITYKTPPAAAPAPFHPPSAQQAKAVVAQVPTSAGIGKAVTARRVTALPASSRVDAGALRKGDFVKVVGTDQYGKPTTVTGHVQTVGAVKIAGKPGHAIQLAEHPDGSGGWRATVYVKDGTKVDRGKPPAATPSPSTATPAAAPSTGASGQRAMELADRLTDKGIGRKLSGAARADLAKQFQDLHDNGDPKGHLTQLAEGYGQHIAAKTTRYTGVGMSAKVKLELNNEIKKALGKDGGKTPLTDLMIESWSDDAAKTKLKHVVDALDRGSLSPAPAAPNAPAMPAGHPAPYSDKVLRGLSDAKIDNGITMHGTHTPLGKQLVAEKARRTAARLAQGTPSAGPTPAAPLPATASAAIKHAAAVASRSAPGAGLAKTHLRAYDKITPDEFDSLPDAAQATILDDLKAAKAKFLDPKKQLQVQKIIDRLHKGKPAPIGTPPPAPPKAATAAPAAHGFTAALDRLRTERDPAQVMKRWIDLQTLSTDPTDRAELEKVRAGLEADTSHPLWMRARLATDAPGYNAPRTYHVNDAIYAATNTPGSAGYQVSSNGLYDLWRPSDAELGKLPPVVAEAIRERRQLALSQKLALGGRDREEALRTVLGDPHDVAAGKILDTKRYDSLDKATQGKVRAGLSAHVGEALGKNYFAQGSEWKSVEDRLDKRQYTAAEQNAIETAHRIGSSPYDQLSAYARLSKADIDAMPEAHRKLIRSQVENYSTHGVGGRTRTEADTLLAHWNGTYPNYSNQWVTRAALAAGIEKSGLSGDDRLRRYNFLSADQFKELNATDRANVAADMANLASDPTAGLGPADRYQMQAQSDYLQNMGSVYTAEQRAAYRYASPSFRAPDNDRLQAYDKLSQREYTALPSAYRDAIRADIDNIGTNDPIAAHALLTKLVPGYQPPHAPAAPVTHSKVPEIEKALDALYGRDPKAHTTAFQLAAYGGLRKSHFDSLHPREQQQLLGDLSYIQTTSKAAGTQEKARKLIDRFTPAGTPSGSVGAQPVLVPPNAVAGQTRVADPAGTPGTLKLNPNPGASGDGWFSKPGGGRVWGKYGAAGLLLRNVGSDGRDRYLMVQRGPAISDPGKWQFPGGAKDANETFHEGAAREVVEELGFGKRDLEPARVHGEHTFEVPGGWKYVSIAATIDKQLQPDLSTHHARAETSDAKWMTVEEIEALDKGGKLLSPLAGGALQRNVLSLFPTTSTVARPAPLTRRQKRLTGTPSAPVMQATTHKPGRGRNLVATSADQDKLRADVSATRKNYRGKTADERLAAIGAMQGFDEAPTVVSKSEMDRLLATGDYVEIWRGVSGGGGKTADQINEDFRTGPAYYGTGIFGNGYYFSTEKSVAQQYASGWRARGHGSGMVRALLPKAAKTDTHAKVLTKAQAASSSARGGYRYARYGGHGAGQGTLHDEGRMGAAMGLDAIEITHRSHSQGGGASHIATPGRPSYLILNRSTLIVEEA